jgi:putative intracellular protease/amidase
MANSDAPQVAVVLFEDFGLLDVFGPLEVLGVTGQFGITLLGPEQGPVRSAQGPAVVADKAYRDAPPPDIVLVPGGIGTRRLVADQSFTAWLSRWASTSAVLASVCTGSGLLASAGLLDGYQATSNKRAFSWARAGAGRGLGTGSALGARPQSMELLRRRRRDRHGPWPSGRAQRPEGGGRSRGRHRVRVAPRLDLGPLRREERARHDVIGAPTRHHAIRGCSGRIPVRDVGVRVVLRRPPLELDEGRPSASDLALDPYRLGRAKLEAPRRRVLAERQARPRASAGPYGGG